MSKIVGFKTVGGPYGDATTDYEVDILPGTTILDFCKEVLHRDEWGEIRLNDPFGDILMKYGRDGSFEFPDGLGVIRKYIRKNIKSVRANGGWSLMNYYIVPEDVKRQ